MKSYSFFLCMCKKIFYEKISCKIKFWESILFALLKREDAEENYFYVKRDYFSHSPIHPTLSLYIYRQRPVKSPDIKT